jgi:hypothetical protein
MAATEERLNGSFERPENLLIVGLDVIPGAAGNKDADDLLDEDRLDGPGEGLIESIMTHGVKIPVMVRVRRFGKSDRCYIVIDGRQRVQAARKADAKLRAKGDDKGVLVPYVIKDGDQSTVIIANEWRRDDPIWVKAKKAIMLERRGFELSEILSSFSDGQGHTISKQTLGNWKSLLRVTPEIMDRIKSGELSVTIGYELGKLKPDDQLKALSHVQEKQGSLSGSNGVANVKAAASIPSAPKSAPETVSGMSNGQVVVGPAPKSNKPDPALAPRREHVAPATPEPVIVKDARLSSRYLETMAEVLAASDKEPHENDEQKLAYAVFAFASGREGVESLSEFDWLYKLAKRYAPKKKKGAS